MRAGKQLPPEWSMPDLVRTVIGDEAIHIPGFIKDSYVDVMLHGQNSWLCNEVFQFLDLITSSVMLYKHNILVFIELRHSPFLFTLIEV